MTRTVVRGVKFIPLALTLLCSALPSMAAPAWQHHGGSAPPPPRQSAPPPNNPSNAAPHGSAGYGGNTFRPQGAGPHRGDWLRKYGMLPPHEQEKKLENDPSFRSLPPERQNHLLDRLRKFNSQPPEKKQQILNRMETFQRMTPEQQQQARSLFDRYRNLPEDQKTKVSQAYRRLRGMPPSARNELLNSDEFRNNYSDEERNLLRGMADLNMGPTR